MLFLLLFAIFSSLRAQELAQEEERILELSLTLSQAEVITPRLLEDFQQRWNKERAYFFSLDRPDKHADQISWCSIRVLISGAQALLNTHLGNHALALAYIDESLQWHSQKAKLLASKSKFFEDEENPAYDLENFRAKILRLNLLIDLKDIALILPAADELYSAFLYLPPTPQRAIQAEFTRLMKNLSDFYLHSHPLQDLMIPRKFVAVYIWLLRKTEGQYTHSQLPYLRFLATGENGRGDAHFRAQYEELLRNLGHAPSHRE